MSTPDPKEDLSKKSKPKSSKKSQSTPDPKEDLSTFLEEESKFYSINIHDFQKQNIENGFIQFVHNIKLSIIKKPTPCISYNPIFLSHLYKYNPSSFNIEYIASQINFFMKNRIFSLAQFQGFFEGDKEDGFVPIILTDRPSNGPLSSLFEKANVLNQEQKFIIICGIAHGLSWIHENGFIHSNLNPTTVYVDENNFPKICDYIFVPPFEVTTVVKDEKKSFKYDIIQNPNSSDEIDQSIDIYNFGLLIYYILCEQEAVLKSGKILYPIYFSEVWKELINSCIDKNPKNRPKSQIILKLLLDKKDKYISSIDPYSIKDKVDISLKAINYLKLIRIDMFNTFKNTEKFNIFDNIIFNKNNIGIETKLTILGAEKGDVECLEEVASFCSLGKNNLIKDKYNSYLCYELAANKGSVESLTQIAYMNAECIGTHRNLNRSYALYKKALDQANTKKKSDFIISKMKHVETLIKSIKLKNIQLDVSKYDIEKLFKDNNTPAVTIRIETFAQEKVQHFTIAFNTEDDLHKAENDIRQKKIILNGRPIEFISLINDIEEFNHFKLLYSFLPIIDFDKYNINKEYHTFVDDSMSVFYIVNDKSNEQCFAFKTFSKIMGDELIKSLKSEIIITSQFNHPSIVKYDGFNQCNHLFSNFNPTLLMKFIPKYNLENAILEIPTGWNNTTKLKVIIGIVSGLIQLFYHNISHYNLCTENILLNENFEPVFCNFGFLDDKLNEKTINAGKLVSMAPEFFNDFNNFSENKFEINSYSFGIILYQILTDKSIRSVYPCSKNIKDIQYYKLKNYIPPLPDQMNPVFKDLIRRCLDISYYKRPDPVTIFNDLVEVIKSNGKILPDVDINSVDEFINKHMNLLPDIKILKSKNLIQTYIIHSPEVNAKINDLQNQMNANNPKFSLVNNKMSKLIKGYSFLYISTEVKFEETQQIYQNIKESKILIIDHIQTQDLGSIISELHFILSFQKTVIVIIKELLFSFLQQIICSNNEEIKFCFRSNTKDIFDESVAIKYIESRHEKEFEKDVLQISKQLNIQKEYLYKFKDFWNIINLSISSYFLMKCYYKTSINRIHDFYISKNKRKEEKIIDDYIELRQIEHGKLYNAILIYIIPDEKLAVIKKPINESEEIKKLVELETSNFNQIDHPFIPKIYGKTNEKNYSVVEFINGNSFTEIQSIELSETIQYKIMIQMLSILDYIHENGFIYQNLNPENLIIDKNNNIILINFDRMIKAENVDKDNKIMSNISHIFLPPEIHTNNISFKSDIYSFGQMIYFIFNRQVPNKDIKKNMSTFSKGSRIQHLYHICTNLLPKERPSIKEIIKILYELIIYRDDIDIISENITPKYLTEYGKMANDYDIRRSIRFLTMASDLNYPDAQEQLGIIYFEQKDQQFDYSKFQKTVKIGQGDYSQVFAIENKETKEILVEKVFYDYFDNYTENEKIKIMIDISIVLHLNNRSICKVIEFSPYGFLDDKNPVIIREYLPNGSLDDIIECISKNKEVPGWDDTKKYLNILEIAHAMLYLHSNDILHRNLTTKSILEDEDFSPKIINCCISKDFHSVQSMMKMLKNSPFCAPEVYINDEYTKASEVYSFGMIVYSIMANKLPYSECSQYQIFTNTIEGIPPIFDKLIPGAYQKLILMCISKNPSERPPFERIIGQLNSYEFIYGTMNKEDFWQYTKGKFPDMNNILEPCPLSAIKYWIRKKREKRKEKENKDEDENHNKEEIENKDKDENHNKEEIENKDKDENHNKEEIEDKDEDENKEEIEDKDENNEKGEEEDKVDEEYIEYERKISNEEGGSLSYLPNNIKTVILKSLKHLCCIGEGGQAKIFLVKNMQNGAKYAAKVFITNIEDYPIEKQLEREIIFLSKANHQAIMKLIGYNKSYIYTIYQKIRPSIFTEYFINGNLRDIISQLNPTQKLIVMYGIASAMSYLHSLNILHRDLNPKNVLLNKFLFPKLCDFGLAIQIPQQNNDPSIKGVFGTAGFIAPEIYRVQEYSKAGDVYSYGILIYELLSNTDPYFNQEDYVIMHSVSHIKNRPAIKKVNEENYKNLIEQCWSDDPKKRPTFDEIVNELANNQKYITESIDVDLFKKYVSFIQEQKLLPGIFKKTFLKK